MPVRPKTAVSDERGRTPGFVLSILATTGEGFWPWLSERIPPGVKKSADSLEPLPDSFLCAQGLASRNTHKDHDNSRPS